MNDKTRLNLTYTGIDTRRRLDKIKALGHHGTDTAAIARALRLYEALLDERSNGATIVIDHGHGIREAWVL